MGILNRKAKYVGNIFSEHGIEPDLDKIEDCAELA